MTIAAKARYATHLIGVKIASILPMLLMPPHMISAIKIAAMTIVIVLSAPKPWWILLTTVLL